MRHLTGATLRRCWVFLGVAALLLASLAPAASGTVPAGTVAAWGRDDFGQVSDAPSGDDFVAIAGGGLHSVALRSDGSIVGWGHDADGEASPPAGNDFVAIAAGGRHSLALRADGSIAAWGSNGSGESSPPAGNDFVAIAAGGYHGLALRVDGSIVGWGRNDEGQASPPAGNDFVAISAGAYHSLALRADGSIAAWGRSFWGEGEAPAGNDYVAVAAGGYHSLALRSDGSIIGWGRDDDGQASPPPGGGFVAVAGGGRHSLALRADGSIAAWGRNTSGEASPPGGNDFARVAAGWNHSLALVRLGPPGAFGKAAPPEGAAGQSGEAVLKWEGAPGADSYEYCVDTSDDEACGGSWESAGASTTAQLTGLAEATTYFWQVRAHNGAGTAEADGGSWWSFTTGLPEGFGKSAPVDGASGQSAALVLSWEGVSGADSFEYCVDTSDDDACGGSWVSAGSATQARPSGLAYETGYFWQVRATNSFGTTQADGGAWWSFSTKPAPPVEELTFHSAAAYDGWVLEREEASGKGGILDGSGATACVGDDEADRQYRSVLHFDTSALPDDAVVVGVTVRVRRAGLTGTNPFGTHGKLLVDIRTGAFHDDPTLESVDFHALGSRGRVGRFHRMDAEGWYRAPLRIVAYPLVNLTGITQFRLRFALGDDDDQVADCLWFWTGDAPVAADRPELIVSYYIP